MNDMASSDGKTQRLGGMKLSESREYLIQPHDIVSDDRGWKLNDQAEQFVSLVVSNALRPFVAESGPKNVTIRISMEANL